MVSLLHIILLQFNCIAHQKTRKVLAEKIAQLNSAIDDVSSQLKPEDSPNAVNSDEVESAL